ncbi:hypothetical protein DSO57_1005316 [Entomophthora muscae]|uniref:Uncharacterized protein n=2 Tax=Entomophthora muscae TaxID=34485 RepID=A0ACC2USU0_9FUNG|nr:hypothetical protein DSO57_1014606 [Entomophthora muscae]KAJ9090145.1 hypothetical protein DSO57_1005316 [Entomophthora muscae]
MRQSPWISLLLIALTTSGREGTLTTPTIFPSAKPTPSSHLPKPRAIPAESPSQTVLPASTPRTLQPRATSPPSTHLPADVCRAKPVRSTVCSDTYNGAMAFYFNQKVRRCVRYQTTNCVDPIFSTERACFVQCHMGSPVAKLDLPH